MSSLKLLALSALATMASSNLVIYGPTELKDKFDYLGMIRVPNLCRLQDPCFLLQLRKHPLRPVHGNPHNKLTLVSRSGESTTTHPTRTAALVATSPMTSAVTQTASSHQSSLWTAVTAHL